MPRIKRLPSLTQLRHLVALAEHGHFGRAAASCLITQSSLSASLKELESVFATTLVERTRRWVRLTPLAEEVVARARRVLLDVGDMVDLVAAGAGPLTGDFRLGVIPTIAPFLLPRVLPALTSAYPGLRLYLREGRSADLVKGLAAGDLDVLLLAFPYPLAGFESRVFAEDRFWIAFPEGHEFAAAERLVAADLAGADLLLLEEGHCLRDQALSVCAAPDDAPDDALGMGFRASSLHTLVLMVDNGLGLTLLPKMAIDAGITRGTHVRVRPLEGEGAGRRIGLAWRASSPFKEDFSLLADHFRDELATPITDRSMRDQLI
jgi:LysR family transcriptional regulator, hydrogen peroxide-inducible genes activator